MTGKPIIERATEPVATAASDLFTPTHRVVGTRRAGERVEVKYRSWHDDRYFGVRNELGEGYLIRGDLLDPPA